MNAIRIAIVDDHPTLLMGLAALLGNDPHYAIVGTGEQAVDALALAEAHDPDLVLIDLSMPGDVFAVIRALATSHRRTRLLIFTAFADVALAVRAFDCGAHGFALKGSPARELHEAIAAVVAGHRYISPAITEKVQAALHQRDAFPRLSAREQQLVDCLLRGMTNREIADTLSLTEKTVKHYMTSVMNKLNAKSRLEVALEARRLGLDTQAIEEPARPDAPQAG